MPEDAMVKVRQAEHMAKQKLQEAAAEARAIIKEATKQGKAALELARTDARDKSAELLEEADRAAAKNTLDADKESSARNEAERAVALARMDQAADLIVERVVGRWQ